MEQEEILQKEIDIIQNVINRMANNSFLLKGWLITIVVAVLAINKDTALTDHIEYISLILLLPLITFWYLDAFFLHKEKCYRELYNWVINNRNNIDDYKYSLDYSRFENKVEPVYKVMYSETLRYFYGVSFTILAIIIIYNLIN